MARRYLLPRPLRVLCLLAGPPVGFMFGLAIVSGCAGLAVALLAVYGLVAIAAALYEVPGHD